MYYRLEYQDGTGVFQKPNGYIDSKALKTLGQTLKIPKILMTNQHPRTKSWFTEYGYQRYKGLIDDILVDANSYPYNRNLLLLRSDNPGEILSKGKVQIVVRKEQ